MILNQSYKLKLDEVISSYIENRNIKKFSNSILLILKEYGFVYIKNPSSYELFYQLSEELGKIIHWDNIQVKKMGTHAAYRANEIMPHTDTADAHIMGWWCENQDEIDGASFLIDSKQLISIFTNDELNVLKNIKLKYNNEHDRTKDNFLKFDEVPLLYERWGCLKINYAPWVELVSNNSLEEFVVDKFRKEFQITCEENIKSIRLEKDQLLFIDNGRFLHSRKKIDENSQRCLKRVWINTGGLCD